MEGEEEKFQNKYRIPSTRLEKYDYSEPGFYAVTICVDDRQCHFGAVAEGDMILSEIGKIVRETRHASSLPIQIRIKTQNKKYRQNPVL